MNEFRSKASSWQKSFEKYKIEKEGLEEQLQSLMAKEDEVKTLEQEV